MFLKSVSAAVRDWLVKVEFITVGLWNIKMKATERDNKSNHENTEREIKGGKSCRKEEENRLQGRRQKNSEDHDQTKKLKTEVEEWCSFSH